MSGLETAINTSTKDVDSDSSNLETLYANLAIQRNDDSFLGIDSQSTSEMDCPHNKVSLVIGAKGVIVHSIMRRTGCKVVVIQDGYPDGEPRKVVITGPSKRIESAKKMISAVIANGPSSIQNPIVGQNLDEPEQTIYMQCPHDKVSIVIGAKGAIVQDIMRRSGCRISIHPDAPHGEPKTVSITGKGANVELAKSLISTVIERGPTALVQVISELHNSTSLEIDCPQDKIGCVIGARGSVVQDIMRKSGCKIVVKPNFLPGEPRKIILAGTNGQIARGRKLVNLVIESGPAALHAKPNPHSQATITKDIKVERYLVERLLGPHGSTLKDIQQRFDVTVNIFNGEETTTYVRISGDKNKVQGAAGFIWNIVQSESINQSHSQYTDMSMSPQGYGAVMAPSSSMYLQQQQQQQSQHVLSSYHFVGQGLGPDGSYGRLLPPVQLYNGMLLQVWKSI